MSTIELSRTFTAPPERVFSAWTDADLMRRWVLPHPSMVCSACTVDGRPGGGYEVVFGPPPSGDAYREVAVYDAFEPVSRLVMRLHLEGEGMDERTTCTMVLTPVEGGTRLDLVDDGLSSDEIAAGHVQGWTACLDGIERVLSDEGASLAP